MSFRSMNNEPPKPKKHTLKTLAECWRYFEAAVIPAGASAKERERAEMVFYSGAAFMFDQNVAIGDDDVTEDAGVAHMKALQQELRDYRNRLAKQVQEKFPVMGRA